MKKLPLASIVTGMFLSLALVAPAFADDAVTTTSINVAPTSACVALTQNMSRGATDASSAGNVTMLQTYLAHAGYLSNTSIIGVFGPLTQKAVISFQAAQHLTAQGYVGPLTRARIQSLTCGGITVTGSPTVTALTPAQGPVGTTITITGKNFTDSNIVHFGGGGVGNQPSTNGGTQITYTVPNSIGPYCPPGHPCPYFARLTTPGDYPIYVENSNGTSSPLTFTVGTTSDAGITVSKVVVPDTVRIGEDGTWTLYLSLPANAGNTLTYAVDWGDGNTRNATPASTMTQSIARADLDAGTTLAVFTHAYGTLGDYTPTFNVSDDNGHKVRVVSSVTVTN